MWFCIWQLYVSLALVNHLEQVSLDLLVFISSICWAWWNLNTHKLIKLKPKSSLKHNYRSTADDSGCCRWEQSCLSLFTVLECNSVSVHTPTWVRCERTLLMVAKNKKGARTPTSIQTHIYLQTHRSVKFGLWIGRKKWRKLFLAVCQLKTNRISFDSQPATQN